MTNSNVQSNKDSTDAEVEVIKETDGFYNDDEEVKYEKLLYED